MQRLTKKPAGNFLGHFKASRCSQSSASSYHPTAQVAEGCASEHPQHYPQPQHSQLCWPPAGTMAQILGHVFPPTVPQQPWQKRTGMGEQGGFLNQHSSLLLMWTSTYSSLHPRDRGSWRNRNSAGEPVKVITF